MPHMREYLYHVGRRLIRSKNQNMMLSQTRNIIRWHSAFSLSSITSSKVSSLRINSSRRDSRMAKTQFEKREKIVHLDENRRFMIDCFLAVGTPRNHAEAMADLLREADYQGHYSHGMNRLEMYINDIQNKTCDPNVTPKVLKDSPGTAWVDGKNGLGAVIGNFCMTLAIEKAKKVGIGMVTAKNSNHYGIAGWYTKMAAKQKLIGFSCTNTSPLMVPTRAKKAAIGTNPISIAAPTGDQKDYVLDMATTAVAVGKIEIKQRKQEPIPEGWALNACGKSTTNADTAFRDKLLLPLGGMEENGGYKGYGLGIMVEMFCGILSDSRFGPNIRMWTHSSDAPSELAQCFMAINPECFAPGFENRMKELLENLRGMEPIDQQLPVFVPGDKERLHMEQVNREGGVKYVPNQINNCNELAKRLSVEPLKFVS